MVGTGKLTRDPLFLGLTRPSMLFGVTYKYATFNGLVALMAFIITTSFIYLLVILPVLHMIAYLICLKEPIALELLIGKLSKCSKCKNKMFYGGANSYDLY